MPQSQRWDCPQVVHSACCGLFCMCLVRSCICCLGTADFTARTASPIGNIIFIKLGLDSMTENVRHSEREGLAMPPSLCTETSWVDRVPCSLSMPPLKIHMLEIAPQWGSVRRQGPSSDAEVMRSSPSWWINVTIGRTSRTGFTFSSPTSPPTHNLGTQQKGHQMTVVHGLPPSSSVRSRFSLLWMIKSWVFFHTFPQPLLSHRSSYTDVLKVRLQDLSPLRPRCNCHSSSLLLNSTHDPSASYRLSSDNFPVPSVLSLSQKFKEKWPLSTGVHICTIGAEVGKMLYVSQWPP